MMKGLMPRGGELRPVENLAYFTNAESAALPTSRNDLSTKVNASASVEKRPHKQLSKIKDFFTTTGVRPFSEFHSPTSAGPLSAKSEISVLVGHSEFAKFTLKPTKSQAMSDSSSIPIRSVQSQDTMEDNLDSSDQVNSETSSIKQRKSSRPSKRIEKQQQILSMLSPRKLFDFLVVVSLVVETIEDPVGRLKQRYLIPKITYRFPPELATNSSDSIPSVQTTSTDDVFVSDQSLLDNIPLFCFPEWDKSSETNMPVTVDEFIASDRSSSYLTESETFSFVLTDIQQTKRFGYCRRLLSDVSVESDIPVSPTGATTDVVINASTKYITRRKKLPEVFCVVSPAGCFSLFNQLLNIVEQRRGSGNKTDIYTFLKAVIAQPFPKPGRTITIKTFAVSLPPLMKFSNPDLRSLDVESKADSQPIQEYQLYRPIDVASLEHVSFTKFFASINLTSSAILNGVAPQSPFQTLVALLAALLLERRIIFVSKSLQTLSDCCNAAMSLIYPLEWQHVFIPILPRRLMDFLSSPTPYIIGVLKSEIDQIIPPKEYSGSIYSAMPLLDLDEVFVLDVDTGVILRHDTDEQDRSFIPFYLINRLKTLLDAYVFREYTISKMHLRSNPNDTQSAPESETQLINTAIADTLLKFFILLFGCYRECMDVEVVEVSSSQSGLSTKGIKSSGDLHDSTWERNNETLGNSPLPRHELHKSRSEDVVGNAEHIRVWFDTASFIQSHPLVLGTADSPWLGDIQSIGTTFHVRVPSNHSMQAKKSAPHLKSLSAHSSAIPSALQRTVIAQFLTTVSISQSFQYFIQIREDAFQYHYQAQLEKSKGKRQYDWLDLMTDADRKSGRNSNPEQPKLKDVPSGLKSYYALSQSRFEKKVSQMEHELAQKMQSRVNTS